MRILVALVLVVFISGCKEIEEYVLEHTERPSPSVTPSTPTPPTPVVRPPNWFNCGPYYQGICNLR